MYSQESRTVSLQDIQLVKNLIECCLQLYMTKREVVYTLFHQAKIEPGFTELVWQKLEAQNRNFFRIYTRMLILKDQIIRYNQLLDRQIELMNHWNQTRVSWTPLPDRFQTHSVERSTVPVIKSENTSPVGIIPHDYTNGTFSPHQRNEVGGNTPVYAGRVDSPAQMVVPHQLIEVGGNRPVYAGKVEFPTQTAVPQQRIEVGGNKPVYAGRVDFPAQMMVPHNSNAGTMQGFDERFVKTEGFYSGNSPAVFQADNYSVDTHFINFSNPPSDGGESSPQSFSESVLDAELYALLMEQTAQSNTLSGLMPPFLSTGVGESDSGSPFLGTPTNTNNWGTQQGNGRVEKTNSGNC